MVEGRSACAGRVRGLWMQQESRSAGNASSKEAGCGTWMSDESTSTFAFGRCCHCRSSNKELTDTEAVP